MVEKEILLQEAERLADRDTPEILEISHRIFANPELAYTEFKAAQLLQDTVEKRGFSVQRGEGLLQTALRGEHDPKPGALNIGFISEFDALPNGHACGHRRAVLFYRRHPQRGCSDFYCAWVSQHCAEILPVRVLLYRRYELDNHCKFVGKVYGQWIDQRTDWTAGVVHRRIANWYHPASYIWQSKSDVWGIYGPAVDWRICDL